MNGIKRGPRKLSHFCHVHPQQKDTICEPLSGLSLDSKSAGAFILDFPAYRTEKFVYMPVFCYSSPTG